ncbi:MAG: biopolymer transporter ExbD [Lewinellaceae bacterium]|nr:biopolymer transporter ExbD [Lewinellaceae bacterium]
MKRRVRVTPSFSLAAMIDIIFLLLMFFMLTSKFVTPNALNLQLPSSSSTTMASPSLAVSVNTKGEFFLDGDPIRVRANEKIGPKLQAMLEAKIKASKADPSTTTITVAADKTVPLDYVVTILNVANNLRVKTILATDPEE